MKRAAVTMSGAGVRPATSSDNERAWERIPWRPVRVGMRVIETEPNPNVQALLNVLQRPDVPEDPATPRLLFERSRLAGFSGGQAAALFAVPHGRGCRGGVRACRGGLGPPFLAGRFVG